MYKLKKGIDELSPNDLKIISVLLESLTISNIVKVYYKETKNNIIKIISQLKNKNANAFDSSSKTIGEFLNAQYNNYPFQDYYKNISLFLSLVKLKLNQNNKNSLTDPYYNMINTASKLYLLPKEITPAAKADLISTNAYITLLKNLRKIIDSISKNQLKAIEDHLDSFLLEIKSTESTTLEEMLQLEELTSKKVLEHLTKEHYINNISNYSNVPKILIKTVNTVIKALCQKNKIFTQMNCKPWTFIMFKGNERVYWLLEVSPLQIFKGFNQLMGELISMIIFIAKVLLDESYLPLDHQLPNFNLAPIKKDALVKRNQRSTTINSELDRTQSKIKDLETKINKNIKTTQILIRDKNKSEENISVKEKELIDLNNKISQSNEKLIRLTRSYDGLNLKKTSSPRIKKRLITLRKSSDDMRDKIDALRAEINKIEKVIRNKKIFKKQLEDKLLNRNNEISKFKIEDALLRRKLTEYEHEKHELKESNAFYFAIHWGKYFDNFKISSEIYDSLINYNFESLLLIEKVLVELDESTDPSTVGYKTKKKEDTFVIKVTQKNNPICHIFYKADNKKKVLLKEIVK